MGIHQYFDRPTQGQFGEWREYNLTGLEFHDIALPVRPQKNGDGIIALFKNNRGELKSIGYGELLTMKKHLEGDLKRTGNVTKRDLRDGSFIESPQLVGTVAYETYMKVRQALKAANGQRHCGYANCMLA